ncbi:MAG: hypothetical protein NVS3B21_20680 [Acidimicrobiales bacterium]
MPEPAISVAWGLIDCTMTAVDTIDVALLLEELLTRRNARTFTLLGPHQDLADQTQHMATAIGSADRVKIVYA